MSVAAAGTRAGDPVLMHVGNARRAGRKYGIPAAVILGILHVEGGTDSRGRPVRPADGAGPPSYGQFTFGTGAAYGVRFGDSASETDAIARYLRDLGFDKNPERAIAAYNGGPGNPQYGYARKVINAARRYAGAGHDPKPPSPNVDATRTDDEAPGGLVGAAEKTGAVRAITWLSLAAAGTVLLGLGTSRALGARGAA